MKNKKSETVRFTISLDKDLDRLVRVEAAKNDMSRTTYIAHILQEKMKAKYGSIRKIQEPIRGNMTSQTGGEGPGKGPVKPEV